MEILSSLAQFELLMERISSSLWFVFYVLKIWALDHPSYIYRLSVNGRTFTLKCTCTEKPWFMHQSMRSSATLLIQEN